METHRSMPQKTLSFFSVLSLIVGVVIGTGIFKTPSLVAANTKSMASFFLAWILGGFLSLIGALCYAELITTYPHAGGDYHYLSRAFGKRMAYFFGWARMTVIQPGSIAMLAFIFGDYVREIVPSLSSPVLAFAAVFILTFLNVQGSRQGTRAQNILTTAKVVGLLCVLAAGTILAPPLPGGEFLDPPKDTSFGLAMVFVLLTYGGWNEAAYISAELKGGRRTMLSALIWGILIITSIYLLANFAYFHGLGREALTHSDVVAADLLRRSLGDVGAKTVSLLIALSALGAINATIFTGARTNYALGQDYKPFRFLGHWRESTNTPANALIFQGTIATALLSFGAITRKGFVSMVDYTAPIFWFFFFLTGISLFVLRSKEREIPRQFAVPLYPLTPLIFVGACLYMLRASVLYTGSGALLGIVICLFGSIFLIFHREEK